MRRYLPYGLMTILIALTVTVFSGTPGREASADSATGSPRIRSGEAGDRVTLCYDGFVFHTFVSAPTVRGALAELGLPIFDTSRLFPAPDTAITPDLTIRVDNPIFVTLGVGGQENTFQTHAVTVGELLTETTTELGALDEINLPPASILLSNQRITIARVHEATELRAEAIPYDSKTVDNPSLLIGKTEVTQTGRTGEKELEYKLRFRDGEKIGEALIAERILAEPIEQITGRGTKHPPVAAPIPARSAMQLPAGATPGSASWYYASGFTAASRDYPTGTRLRITDLGDGQSVDVTVVTYGPATWTGHLIDLSPDAFQALAPLGAGVLRNVSVEAL